MPLRVRLPARLSLSVLPGGNPPWAPGDDEEVSPASDPAVTTCRVLLLVL